jgi:signal transduction histidine kinase
MALTQTRLPRAHALARISDTLHKVYISARLDVNLAERQLQANLATLYREAQTALAQIDQAGEATTLEVVDAQTTAAQARNAYDDGLARYRVASASGQIVTGNLRYENA